MKDRCIRCHTILTSEDKYHYSISCHQCEEDIWHGKYRENVPFRCAGRYVSYQLRWLRNVAAHIGSLLLRGVRRFLDAYRSGVRHDRRR